MFYGSKSERVQQLIGNKAKDRIAKPLLQENQAHQIFPENEHFLHPDMHTYVHTLVCCALFSCNTCFEITPFALLQANSIEMKTLSMQS